MQLGGWRRAAGTILLLAALASPAFAYTPDEVLADPALEARARALSVQLRCLICQNQSIDDSEAPLAKDLRLLIRERLKAGASDAQVKDFVVARYGEFVLLKPRFALHTLALWLAPFVLLGLGIAVAFRRRSAASPAAEPLTTAERERLDDLLRKQE
jgi:cytochrome c-type biogenesis protein CcmH